MKLKDRRRSPVGGFFYDDPLSKRTITTQSSFDALIKAIKSWHASIGITSPSNLVALVEDQICTRQPPDRCYYTKGLGDMVSQVIHAAANTVDKALGTQLEKKARGCGGCARRRMSLNSR